MRYASKRRKVITTAIILGVCLNSLIFVISFVATANETWDFYWTSEIRMFMKAMKAAGWVFGIAAVVDLIALISAACSSSYDDYDVGSMLICETCGRMIPATADHCSSCGREVASMADVRQRPARSGEWKCACGRINQDVFSTCTCGRVKPAKGSDPAPKKSDFWHCTCGRENPNFVSSCVCGVNRRSVVEAKPTPAPAPAKTVSNSMIRKHRFCPECGEAHSENAKFCSVCGAKLEF